MRISSRSSLSVLMLVLLFASAPVAGAADEGDAPAADRTRAPSACVTCHGELDEEGAVMQGWEGDIHREVGLGCADCHGGDPSPELADDAEASMSEAAGFRPAPERTGVPAFCARCHADVEYMKSFNPQARVDQMAEYRTSAHGKRLLGGDPVPANCVDCHGVHGIRHVGSPDSPVFAANVPETCGRCHADAELMAPYGLPTGQLREYRRSVHGAALLEREDTAAPACNDCHGNHGAAPPGVESVANVCGQCHGREASLFRASFKKDLFDMLETAECSTCHGNHLITHPTPELFRSGAAPQVSQGEVTGISPFAASLGDLGPGESAQARWEIVLHPYAEPDDPRLGHRVRITAEGTEPLELDAAVVPGDRVDPDDPLFESDGTLSARLAIKPQSGIPVKAGDALRLRLVVTAGASAVRGVVVEDLPGTGLDTVAGSVCLTCHDPGDDCDKATIVMTDAIRVMDHELRQAEDLLHTAEVRGMDVVDDQFALRSQGITAAVEARALVHAFDPDALVAKTEEAREAASAAREAGNTALAEILFRRKGLAVSLVLILLLLIALAYKIRALDRSRWEHVTKDVDSAGA